MLLIFLMVMTLGLTNAIPFETRSQAANRNIDKSKPQEYQDNSNPITRQITDSKYGTQAAGSNLGEYETDYGTQVQGLDPNQYNVNYGTSGQGLNPGQQDTYGIQADGLNIGEQPSYENVYYGNQQSSGIQKPSSRNQVIAEHITPDGYTDQNLAVIKPNGYDTVNIGNGYRRKNTVYINNGQNGNEDELLVATDNKKQYNPDVVGLTHVTSNSRPGVPPCYQNGVLIHGYPCSVESNNGAQYPGASKTYRIGNGYNNENVVTINSGGASSHRTRPGTDTYTDPHSNKSPRNNYYLIGSGYNNQDYLSFLG